MLLVFTFGGVAKPVNTFLLDGFWQKASMWGVIVFFLAVPLIAIITWIIRRAMGVRSQNRYLGWIFGGLWTLGWISLPLFISSMVKDFRFMEQSEREIALTRPTMNKLVVQVPDNAIRYSGNFSWLNPDDDQGWDITDDSLKVSNVRIAVKKSEDSFYHVTVQRYSAGDNRAKALQRAERIEYAVSSMDSVLSLGSGFGISGADKFRGQKVMVEIQIPVGKQIRFDESVGEKLNPYDIRVAENDNRSSRRKWNRRNWEFDWDNNSFYDWNPDTDYYMTASGKLKEVGAPETVEPSTPTTTPRDSSVSPRRTRDTVDEDERTEEEPAEQVTTQKREIGGDIPTPMPVPFVPTIF
jgi:hypothetical protein